MGLTAVAVALQGLQAMNMHMGEAWHCIAGRRRQESAPDSRLGGQSIDAGQLQAGALDLQLRAAGLAGLDLLSTRWSHRRPNVHLACSAWPEACSMLTYV